MLYNSVLAHKVFLRYLKKTLSHRLYYLLRHVSELTVTNLYRGQNSRQ